MRTRSLLFLFVLVSLFLRTWFAWDEVFGGAFVRFSESDAWYHIRLAENLLHNFPVPITYDPYLRFPGGQAIGVAPGLDYLVTTVALVLAAGSPSVTLLERVAALMPALLGALTVWPVFWIGRRLFTETAGLFAAALAAALPGQFLIRTTVGYADHHAAEILFSTVAIALFIRAIDGPADRRWGRSVWAGVALGAYLSMWSSGAFLVFLLSLGMWVRLTMAHVQGDRRRWDEVWVFALILVTALAFALPIVGRFSFARAHMAAVAGGVGCTIGLAALSALIEPLRRLRRWFPLVAIGLVAAAIALSAWMAPGLAITMAVLIARLTYPAAVLVGEAVSLRDAVPWWPYFLAASFGVALPLAAIALAPIGRAIVRDRRRDLVWLPIWFLVTLAAMTGQVRFGYYLAVPVALLAGWACDRLIARLPKRQDLVFLGVVIVVFFPLVQYARAQARPAPKLTDDWHEALLWMRDHTPEPFGDPAVYFDRYAGMSETAPFPFPASAYGVLSWWDAGHGIIRIARRPVNTNPTQAEVREATEFFLATNEADARRRLDRFGTRYVVLSSEIVAEPEPISGETLGHFHGIVYAAGTDERRYVETYRDETPGSPGGNRILFYPDYYRTMATRLYVYGGRAVEPQGSTFVATFSEEPGPNGVSRKVLRDLRSVGTYHDAEKLVSGREGQTRIVGIDPFETCVPLEPVGSLSLVHRSPTDDLRRLPPAAAPGLVQVFEYRGRKP